MMSITSCILDKNKLAKYDICIFLDSAVDGKGLFFCNPIEIITAYNKKEFFKALKKIDNLKKNKYLAGYMRYEAKEYFLDRDIESTKPLLWFGVFDEFQTIKQVDYTDVYNPFMEINNSICFQDYKEVLNKIKNNIENGNTYQVNYTFDKFLKAGCSEQNLYLALRQVQRTYYCAFIKNYDDTILSFSPELFFEIEGNKIITKPMKGTIKKGKTEEENKINKEFLSIDEKNRAENVMIVDLLRNDIGKICKTGSINVKSLFDIEEYPTLYQMTSTIEGELKENTSFENILEALFPCGSVTGAPKIKTMQIIDQIEKDYRAVYCGAIGYISPEKSMFSVPIRILQKQDKSWQYRVGSGVVWDSDIENEWKECELKAKFLNIQPEFGLIETMLVENRQILYKKEHFARLKNSAEFFEFNINEEIFNIQPAQDGMLRLVLARDGNFDLEYKPLKSPSNNFVKISDRVLDSQNTFLYHKTTYRPWYKEAMQDIINGKYYDILFFNEKGKLCEGARTNVFIEENDALYTPTKESGLLNGVLRQDLLKNKKATEKNITLSDLQNADAIYCGNSVRGLVQVDLKVLV